MQILITGINGYLGTLLTHRLRKRGHRVSGINRDMLYLGGQTLERIIANSDVIINLAGAPILQRWSDNNKVVIYNSRVVTTTNLVNAINMLSINKRPKKLISISAIGIYSNDKQHTEDSTDYNTNFLGRVAKDWEQALTHLDSSIQCNIFRLGLVLGRKSVFIKKLRPLYKMGLGGKIAGGQQAFPFVHESDVAKALIWAAEDLNINTTYNLVAPEHINNAEFTLEFGRQVNRPTFFTVPAWTLKQLYGQASTVMLESPTASSKKIQDYGFSFDYPNISSVLNDILKNE